MLIIWYVCDAVALFVVVPVVVLIANRVIRAAREIDAYATDITVHGAGLAEALEPVGALADTGQLAGSVKAAAVRYVTAIRAMNASTGARG